MGHLIFAHKLVLMYIVSGDQGDEIGVGAEAGALILQVVGDYHVHVFLAQLGLGIFHHVFSFHGKAAEELALASVGSEMGQDVQGAFHLQVQAAVGLLHLLVADMARCVIG